MNRAPHISEPKWNDDPDELERFEERQQRDVATAVMILAVVGIAVVLVLVWWAIVSTVRPGIS